MVRNNFWRIFGDEEWGVDRAVMISTIHRLFIRVIFFLTLIGSAHAQTTGKIAGTVRDKETDEPLVGANVMIENTTLGAACDADGYFFIMNVPPGYYTVRFEMIGYEIIRVEDVHISVNRTYTLDMRLGVKAVELGAVTFVAEEVVIKKDQTSTIHNVSSRDIDILPVESISDVVNLQAGVVQGHFRGGRSNEVSYLVDGIQVDEMFRREGESINVETEVVEELEVITGTFNAEYGKAMSGIVNVVTKDGSGEFHSSFRVNSEYYITSHTDVFINLSDTDVGLRKDYNFSTAGPIIENSLSYVINGRFRDYNGQHNGIRRFEVDNFSDYDGTDSSSWYSEHTGDDKMVPMSISKNLSLFGKLTYKPIPNVKVSLTQTLDDNYDYAYSHYYKYNPNGRPKTFKMSRMTAFQLNHSLSKSAFHELKVASMKRYYGHYVYKNPNDERYVSDFYSRNVAGFSTGGQSKNHTERWTINNSIKYDMTWQLHKNHSVKTGFLYMKHSLDTRASTIRNLWEGTEEANLFEYDSLAKKREYLFYEPIIMSDSSVYSDIYTVSPREFSYYVQDKMEFDLLVINMGLRYDYFDPNSVYPSQLRNPSNQLYFPLKDENGNIVLDGEGNVVLDRERMSSYRRADAQQQLSPRLGIAYQLGKAAVLRFSYGHFFQLPPFYAVYQNQSFLLSPSDFGSTLGNANIQAQKTVQYEVGLWLELHPDMTLELAVFYRDIYDLLSAKVITTYNQLRYGLYSNKDYGNVRGAELKLNIFKVPFSSSVDYTLQYTRGNADNPTFSFDRAGSSKDPVNRLIPMSWDQRHTLNISAGYNTRKYGATVVTYYDTGTPYTWEPRSSSALSLVNLMPNNSRKPYTFKVDFGGYYQLFNVRNSKLTLTLRIYNLLDRLNEKKVYSTTGSAFSKVVDESEKYKLRSDFFDYETTIINPTFFEAPRLAKIGLEYKF